MRSQQKILYKKKSSAKIFNKPNYYINSHSHEDDAQWFVGSCNGKFIQHSQFKRRKKFQATRMVAGASNYS